MMWGTAINWVKLLSSLVQTLLVKMERDKETLRRTDIGDALLQLLHLIREWHRAAQLTNRLLEDWIKRGKPADYKSLDNAYYRQYRAAEHVLYCAGYPSEYSGVGKLKAKKRPRWWSTKADDRNMLTILFVYVPELEKHFRQVVDRRLDQLTSLRENIERKVDLVTLSKSISHLTRDASLSSNSDINPEHLRQFDYSLQELDALAEKLAMFIAEHFKLEGATVQDVSTLKRAAKGWL